MHEWRKCGRFAPSTVSVRQCHREPLDTGIASIISHGFLIDELDSLDRAVAAGIESVTLETNVTASLLAQARQHPRRFVAAREA
jgi:hypothetical protein